MVGSLSGAACAIAAAARDSVIAVFKLRASAPAPETKGALNEVPHTAAYVLKGYVVTISSPGAATQTIAAPKLENVERVPSVAVVEPTEATPMTSFWNAAG